MTNAPSEPQKTSWPIRLYLGALVFAFLTLSLFTPSLSGRDVNVGRARTQAGICLIFVLRLLWAVHRKEQGKTWRVYVVCMLLAVPIWLLVEPYVFALRRTGGG
jgi:4-amino-4-deoxy-L-arabinose transferase-like glycosyltransferase